SRPPVVVALGGRPGRLPPRHRHPAGARRPLVQRRGLRTGDRGGLGDDRRLRLPDLDLGRAHPAASTAPAAGDRAATRVSVRGPTPRRIGTGRRPLEQSPVRAVPRYGTTLTRAGPRPGAPVT